MIPEFVKAWDERKHEVELAFTFKHPDNYDAIVKEVIKILSETDDFAAPDPERITCIDHGYCQGTQLYIIATNEYEPATYWYVRVHYGSCSGCDTLAAIDSDTEYDDDFNKLPPTQGQLTDYMSLALHILQQLKKLGDDDD